MAPVQHARKMPRERPGRCWPRVRGVFILVRRWLRKFQTAHAAAPHLSVRTLRLDFYEEVSFQSLLSEYSVWSPRKTDAGPRLHIFFEPDLETSEAGIVGAQTNQEKQRCQQTGREGNNQQ
jgi:hypothetical protein